ncbi:MAG: hypothetical protein WCC21_18115 [Candidatus Acidiferrales bacterium]
MLEPVAGVEYDARATMTARFRRWIRNPGYLVGIVVFLAAFVVQSGELGSSDTTHRLAATHSFWTSAPAVDPQDYPEFGIHGRGGRLYGWYGVGQSALMLPADVIGTELELLPIFSSYDADPTVRDIVVSYATNISTCVLSALICLWLLGLFGFRANERIAGALALIFCTTFLHYTQNLMENNYIFLLTLTGLTLQYKWFRDGERRDLLIGSLALGANLLTRLTTGLDLVAVALFLLLVSRFSKNPEASRRAQTVRYMKVALPVYLICLALDRAYHWYRFGSVFGTYIGAFGHEQRMLHPALPKAFPFETPFHTGFFGALFTPEKSIFLFDPLLVLTLILSAVAWRRFRPEIRAYLIACGALLGAYICFYAKFTVWSGDFAWGDRYVSTAAQMVAFVSVPLMMRHGAEIGKAVRTMGVVLIAAAVLVQLSSVMFWCPLEIYQMDTLGHPTLVIALRMKNIVAFSLGKMDEWGLTNDSMTYDPWDYQHITAFNFLPFLLARIGKAAGWAVDLITAIWFAALAALLAVLIYVRRLVAADETYRIADHARLKA